MRRTSGGRPNLRPGGGPLRSSARPLALDISPEAASAALKARNWLKTISSEVSNRFVSVFNQELGKLCKACTVNPPTQPHEQGSVYYARPVFSHKFNTGKNTPKRSSSGVWYVIFDLKDTNEDGRPDELGVITVFHAASQAPWEEAEDDDDKNPQETG